MVHYLNILTFEHFSQYHQIIFENFSLKTNNEKDCYILTNCGQIVKCANIISEQIDSVPVIVSQCFLNKFPAYTKPICSSILNIYKVDNLMGELKVWNIIDIKYKMMVIRLNNCTYAIPILHTNII
jgi:hypothetical protein